MSRPAQSLSYVCRSCRRALNNTKTIRQQPSISLKARTFSSSPQSAKTLATFTPTSSPELDAALSKFRSQVFLPSILPPHHQALIYKSARHEILTNPPGVTVTVQTVFPPSASNASETGEESIKLTPLNKFDQPNQAETIKTIKDVLSSTSDAATWDNLIPFLEGMRLARRTSPGLVSMLARKADIQGEGRWNTILTAATMASRTDVRLSEIELTRELVIGAHDRGVKIAFGKSEPRKVLERIVLMLESKDHCGGTIPQKTVSGSSVQHKDMREDPVVVAASLSFAAARAINEQNRKDEGRNVSNATQKLLALDQKLEGGLTGELGSSSREKRPHVLAADGIEALAVLRCALELASKVDMQSSLGKESNVRVSLAIQKHLKAIKNKMASMRSALENHYAENKQRRCLQMADAVEAVVKKL